MNLGEQIMQGLDNELIKKYFEPFKNITTGALPLLTHPAILEQIGQMSADEEEQLKLLEAVHDLSETWTDDFRDYKTKEEQVEFEANLNGDVKRTLTLMDEYKNDLEGFYDDVDRIFTSEPLIREQIPEHTR